MRDDGRAFRRAIGISLLLHFLLLFLVVPRLREAWSSSSVPSIFAVDPDQVTAHKPIEFEFVDLAEEREEIPENPNAPMSDRPASEGNTPQLVQAQGGEQFNRGAPPQTAGPPAQQVPPPRPEQEPVERPSDREPMESRPEGAGEGEASESAQRHQPAVPLPPPGVWMLPPSEGGISENPNREGGGVDAGALSFDTQWYDWGPYAKSMLAQIRRHGRIPEIARMGVTGVPCFIFDNQYAVMGAQDSEALADILRKVLAENPATD